ncbi:MAG: alginate export family protein [Chitinophagaceae bacterium]
MFYNSKKDKLKFGLVIQDTRTWGATGQIQIGDYNNLFLHESYADLLLTDYFSIKIGRQELNYDDARILGNLDWLMQARSHDVVLFKYENPKLFTLHIGGGYNTLGTSLLQQAYVFLPTVGNGKLASTSSN